jgi:hypothetical protein
MGFTDKTVFQPDTTPVGRPEAFVGRALQNFGSHKSTEMVFTQPVTFVVGANGGGKSTIPEALLSAR